MARDLSWDLEELARDLDLVVFTLEQGRRPELDEEAERRRVRAQLERLRDRLQALAREA
jgi:hypothetical protein